MHQCNSYNTCTLVTSLSCFVIAMTYTCKRDACNWMHVIGNLISSAQDTYITLPHTHKSIHILHPFEMTMNMVTQMNSYKFLSCPLGCTVITN